MEIDTLIKEKKSIYSLLIDFIDATYDSDLECKTLIDFLDEQKNFTKSRRCSIIISDNIKNSK